jgi:CHASE2 domain-containing sensor protein
MSRKEKNMITRLLLVAVIILAIMGTVTVWRLQQGLLTVPIVVAIFIMGIIAISVNYLFWIPRHDSTSPNSVIHRRLCV